MSLFVVVCSTLHFRAVHRKINPAGVADGYLLEVQVGFCAIPLGRSYRFITKLRSVCVLNREVDVVRNMTSKTYRSKY